MEKPIHGAEYIGRLAHLAIIEKYGKWRDAYQTGLAKGCAVDVAAAEYAEGRSDEDWLAATMESLKICLGLDDWDV